MRIFLATVLMLLVVVVSPAQGQPETWEVWVYTPTTGDMVRIDSNGFVLDEVALPTIYGFDLPERVEVSPDGDVVAYVLASEDQHMFVLYNLDDEAVIHNSPLETDDAPIYGDSLGFNPQASAFDAGRFALTHTRGDGGWRLLVYRVSDGTLMYDAESTAPVFAAMGDTPGQLPIVQHVSGEDIGLTLIPLAAGGAASYPGYRLDMAATLLTPSSVYRQALPDVLPATDEVILSARDDRLPDRNDDMTGMGVHMNTIHVHDPAFDDTTFPFYHAEDFNLSMPRFIQGGERVAVYASPIPAGESRWRILERSGIPVGELAIGQIRPDTMMGVPDGVVFSASTNDLAGTYPSLNADDSTAVVYIRTTQQLDANIGTVLWRGESGSNARLVWVSPSEDDSVAGDWTQLAGPITAADLGDTTAPSGGDVGLAVDTDARVNTTEGDQANLRTGPGLSFNLTGQLDDGDQVRLLEGPVTSDDLVWWRVRGPNGNEGWLVERADGVQVLVPAGASVAEADPTPTGPTPTPAPGLSYDFAIGQQVIVTSWGNNLNVRRNPNTASERIGQLNSGTILEVIDGPIEANDFTWWQVTDGELTGWVAAGSSRRYWIEAYAGTPPTPRAPVVGVPVPLEPVANARLSGSSQQVTFRWQGVDNVAYYILQVEECILDYTGCSELGRWVSETTSQTITFPEGRAGRWRVWASADELGTREGDPSAWMRFVYESDGTLSAPRLVTPTVNQVYDIYPRVMTFRWQGVTGADSYELEIDYCQGSLDFPTDCVALTSVTVSALSYTLDSFAGAQPGRWRVRAVAADGSPGAWSNWRYFDHLR